MLKNKKIYVLPIIGFLLMILITAGCLKLPMSHKNGISYIDVLFEAASMITATGSNVVNISEQFTWVRTTDFTNCYANRCHWIYVIFFLVVYGK